MLQQYFSNRDADYIYNTKKLRLYSSKTRLISGSEAADNAEHNYKTYLNKHDKNNDISNYLENNEQNYDVLVTFNGNNNNKGNNYDKNNNNLNVRDKENENENDLSNLQNFSSNKDNNRNRPSTAMFSISSKVSLKNHIERIKSKLLFIIFKTL